MEVLKCPTCGAECKRGKDRKRFLQRHPAKCTERKHIAKALASDVKSVEETSRVITDSDWQSGRVPDLVITDSDWD